MYINWKVRLKSKEFWIALIPLVLVLVQLILKPFGITFDLGKVGNYIKDIFNVICAILALLGIVNDPTTKGYSDSIQAMTYQEPKPLSLVSTDEFFNNVDAYNNLEEMIDELSDNKGEEE